MKLTNKTITPVIDADMVVFRAAAASEYEINWGNDLWTLHSYLNDGIITFKGMLDSIYEGLTKKVDLDITLNAPIMVFSDKSGDNFRKDILPTYKGNRVGKRKPVCYKPLREWVEEHYSCRCLPRLEGDDVMGILATMDSLPAPVILVSGDKDFKTVPCDFYDFLKDTLTHITERDALRNHAYQTLIGDTADNYKGCPSYGPVKAQRLLDKTEDDVLWATVIKTFEDAGLTAEDALVQARCAYILHAKDYDVGSGKLTLWNFPNNG